MKPGRNDPCPCGSGKKYKKCCYLRGLYTENYDSEESEGFGENDFFEEEDYLESQDVQYDEDEDDLDIEPDMFYNAINNIRRVFLDKKPHIKEYYKNRKMHSEILDAMENYYFDGKFKKQTDPSFGSEPEDKKEDKKTVEIHLLESSFDLDTEIGYQGFFDIWIYKTAPNETCITDDFIRKHRYRTPEKNEFLHSMLNSKLGLFEITGTDMEEGYVYLKDVFTGTEYAIVDIGLSGSLNNDKVYLYTRIISHNGINFSSGLNFFLKKMMVLSRTIYSSIKKIFIRTENSKDSYSCITIIQRIPVK
jgi:hypothetical protein